MSYVLVWPSDRGPCCHQVSERSFMALAAANPGAVRVGRSLRFDPPAIARPAPLYPEPPAPDWVGLFCLAMGFLCLCFGLLELGRFTSSDFEQPPVSPVRVSKLV